MSDTSQPTVTSTETPSPSPSPTPASTSTETSTKPSETVPSQPPETTKPTEKPSVLEELGKKAGAPKEYEAFKPPEGFEYDAERMAPVMATFKEMNLSQEQGQKLMDLYGKELAEAESGPYKLWEDTQTKWRDELKSDPEIGGKLDVVKSTVSRALDGLGDPRLADEFKAAMTFTGAGNNPAIVRAFYKLARQLTEGGAHPSGGPSPAARPNNQPTSIAQAMYPNLPSG